MSKSLIKRLDACISKMCDYHVMSVQRQEAEDDWRKLRVQLVNALTPATEVEAFIAATKLLEDAGWDVTMPDKEQRALVERLKSEPSPGLPTDPPGRLTKIAAQPSPADLKGEPE